MGRLRGRLPGPPAHGRWSGRRFADLDGEADAQHVDDAALAAAEQALHAAEAASGKPAPELVRTERPGVDEKFKALKTEVAFARADLRKLERDESAASEALEQARNHLAEAERKLAEYQP